MLKEGRKRREYENKRKGCKEIRSLKTTRGCKETGREKETEKER